MDDNTRVVLLALITAVPAWIAAVGMLIVHRNTRTPSGEKIGTVAEQTHAIAHANAALLTQVQENVSNGKTQEA